MSWLILSLLASSVDAVRIVRPDLRDFAAIPANSVPITRSTTEHRRLAQSVSVEVPGSPDAHLVTDLPLLSPEEFPTKHWAGHLPASPNNDKYFFYWLFEPEGNYDKDTVPLIIWLNGGPGCSSMDGLFLENGPFRLEMDEDENYQIKAAEHSWHKSPAYTLYIDQPVGTGLSFTTSGHYPSNDELVNVDFYHFIQSFFQIHSDKFVDQRVRNPLWFSGESHAGHYIPSMMNYILKQNDDLKDGDIEIPLAGAAIGNGWTDPVHQYAAAEAAYGHGIIDRAQLTAMSAQERVCQQKLEKGQMIVSECFRLLDDVVRQSQGVKSEYKISQYDVRKTESTQHSDRDFPPGHKVVETFLGGWPMKDDPGKLSTDISVEVLKAIHATSATAAGQRFQECTDPPYNALAHQDGKGVVEDVIAVLEHAANVKLLFFNGVQDLICNHVGNEVMLEKLPWKHQDDWIKAERFAWRAESEQVSRISGYVKEFENLSFLKGNYDK
jgi:carboxypeptidase D